MSNFSSKEEYVLHLIHCAAYNQASYLAENKTVLDLGCNIGYGAEIISRSASKVIGVDVSERAVTFAKALYGQHGIEFQKVGGEKLPFEDSCFDMVVSF